METVSIYTVEAAKEHDAFEIQSKILLSSHDAAILIQSILDKNRNAVEKIGVIAQRGRPVAFVLFHNCKISTGSLVKISQVLGI